jgi:hypothetical protein
MCQKNTPHEVRTCEGAPASPSQGGSVRICSLCLLQKLGAEAKNPKKESHNYNREFDPDPEIKENYGR